MAKAAQKIFHCSSCGTMHKKWQGQCDGCGEWNTLIEEVANNAPANSSMRKISRDKVPELILHRPDEEDVVTPRIQIGVSELDRVLGGGLVAGSVTLIGGDPGIGKTTLLTQTAAHMARKPSYCLYFRRRSRNTNTYACQTS